MHSFFPPIRPLLKAWGWSFLLCGVLAFVLVGQFAWAVAMPAGEAWRMAERDWLPWALVSPLLFRLVSHLPLERARWRWALPVHLLCALVVIGLSTWWGEVFLPPPPPPQTASTTSSGSERLPPRRWLVAVLFFRMPIYLAIVSVAHSVYFYRRSLAREMSLSQANLAALKMQLQPHFLFNSLNAIAELVHQDPDAADEMLVALSSLLRLSLETSGEQLLPLRRELEFVESYLAIEHARFGDRLRFELDVSPESHGALVPAFLLQPLVENAVRHGLEPRAGEGVLVVSAHRSGETLQLSVSDNGIGLADDQPVREGIGLTNTRARLHALFGGAASLELHRGEGLTVNVLLPFRTTV
jgi:two-component system LytT family sensor kinase